MLSLSFTEAFAKRPWERSRRLPFPGKLSIQTAMRVATQVFALFGTHSPSLFPFAWLQRCKLITACQHVIELKPPLLVFLGSRTRLVLPDSGHLTWVWSKYFCVWPREKSGPKAVVFGAGISGMDGTSVSSLNQTKHRLNMYQRMNPWINICFAVLCHVSQESTNTIHAVPQPSTCTICTDMYWQWIKLLCGQQFVRVQQFALSWSSGGLEVLGIADIPPRFILIHGFRRLCRRLYQSGRSQKDWPWGGCLQIHHNPSPMTWLELKCMMLPCATTIYMITHDPGCLQKAEGVLSSCNRP